MKCEFVGCKNEACYSLNLKVGKKQKLPVCSDCAPEWAKNGSGSPYYDVEKLTEC